MLFCERQEPFRAAGLKVAVDPLYGAGRAYLAEMLRSLGVEVTEIRQVKGLEYDYVVIVDVNASTFPVEDEARYLLHIAATRAAHQLWIVSTGTKSQLLPDWLDR